MPQELMVSERYLSTLAVFILLSFLLYAIARETKSLLGEQALIP
jgi:hypothetical protein